MQDKKKKCGISQVRKKGRKRKRGRKKNCNACREIKDAG